jgi:hypothetical protein
MANVHCAAATENFVVLEHHSVDIPWWEDLVTGIEKPLNQQGYARVPDKPGLGVELALETVKEHLMPGEECFEPTDESPTLLSFGDGAWNTANAPPLQVIRVSGYQDIRNPTRLGEVPSRSRTEGALLSPDGLNTGICRKASCRRRDKAAKATARRLHPGFLVS